jgi:hypothetical protein
MIKQYHVELEHCYLYESPSAVESSSKLVLAISSCVCVIIRYDSISTRIAYNKKMAIL